MKFDPVDPQILQHSCGLCRAPRFITILSFFLSLEDHKSEHPTDLNFIEMTVFKQTEIPNVSLKAERRVASHVTRLVPTFTIKCVT